jgi:hypothetical protein
VLVIAHVLSALRAHSEFFELEFLPFPLGRLDHDPAALAVQRHLLFTDLAEEVHASPRSLVQRELDLVLRELRFDRAPHGVLGLEEPISRHDPA